MNLNKGSGLLSVVVSYGGFLKKMIRARFFSVATLLSGPCKKLMFSVFPFFCLLTFNAHAVDVLISTNVLPAPCDVSLSGGTDGNGNISFGNVPSSSLAFTTILSATPILLRMSGCQEAFSPKLTVGTTFAGTEAAGGPNKWLVNPGQADPTKAGNVGFVMNFAYTTLGWSDAKNANSMNIRDGCTVITRVANTCGAQIPAQWLNVDIPVAVGVTRGSNTSYRSGPLNGTVTFTFSYQ